MRELAHPSLLIALTTVFVHPKFVDSLRYLGLIVVLGIFDNEVRDGSCRHRLRARLAPRHRHLHRHRRDVSPQGLALCTERIFQTSNGATRLFVMPYSEQVGSGGAVRAPSPRRSRTLPPHGLVPPPVRPC
eukprot:SAG11_NODE_123_length_15805_cov_15.133261_15_plen_131_part_00